MRVIFGGTYDPVHIGHLRMATELVEALTVSSVHLMPCYEAVHKTGVSASAQARLSMLQLATKSDNFLCVDDREIRRGESSYTIDSIREVRSEIGREPLCIVMGTDSALGLAAWREAEGFCANTHIVVIQRPSETRRELEEVHSVLTGLGFEWVEAAEGLHDRSSGLALMLNLTQLDVSSTAIRDSVKENKSIRYLVMGAVEEYICDNGLYQE